MAKTSKIYKKIHFYGTGKYCKPNVVFCLSYRWDDRFSFTHWPSQLNCWVPLPHLLTLSVTLLSACIPISPTLSVTVLSATPSLTDTLSHPVDCHSDTLSHPVECRSLTHWHSQVTLLSALSPSLTQSQCWVPVSLTHWHSLNHTVECSSLPLTHTITLSAIERRRIHSGPDIYDMPHLTDHTSQETLLFFNHVSQFLGKLLPTVTSSESYITSQGILFLVGNNMGAVSVTEERARERESRKTARWVCTCLFTPHYTITSQKIAGDHHTSWFTSCDDHIVYTTR